MKPEVATQTVQFKITDVIRKTAIKVVIIIDYLFLAHVNANSVLQIVSTREANALLSPFVTLNY